MLVVAISSVWQQTVLVISLLTILLPATLGKVAEQCQRNVSQTIPQKHKEFLKEIEWGTYRPGLFFGVQPRIKNSISTGLAWFGQNGFQDFNDFRHSCVQGNSKELINRFTKHNGRNLAVQEIFDYKAKIHFDTTFVKTENGWNSEVNGTTIRGGAASLILYATIGTNGEFDTVKYPKNKNDAKVVISGNDNVLGDFVVTIEGDKNNKPVQLSADQEELPGNHDIEQFEVFHGQLDPKEHWKVTDMLRIGMSLSARQTVEAFPNDQDQRLLMKLHPASLFKFIEVEKENAASNVVAIKFNLQDKFSLKMRFESINSENSDKSNEPRAYDDAIFSNNVTKHMKAFDEKFDYLFQLENKGYNEEHVDFARVALSNLLGGIGFFYGDEVIERVIPSKLSDVIHQTEPGNNSKPKIISIDERDLELEDEEDDDEDEENKTLSGDSEDSESLNQEEPSSDTLFTSTPCRSAFPRGFLWDEGFHQLLIGEFDNDLSLEIIKSWMNTMDKDGWISREKILGDEGRSRVPAEFQLQRDDIANPPTLIFPIAKYAQKLRHRLIQQDKLDVCMFKKDTRCLIRSFMTDDESVNGKNLHLTNPKSLGIQALDSIYQKYKLHFEWLNRTQFGDIKPHASGYKLSNNNCYMWRGRTENHTFASGLDDYPRASPVNSKELHLDLMSWVAFTAKSLGGVAEILGYRNEVSKYRKTHDDIVSNLLKLHWNKKEKMFCDLTIDDNGKSKHVCHKGYVSLFPMMLGLVEADSIYYRATLDLIKSKNHLWSKYGVRSLSKQSEYYGADENYWRGPIWVNMNYLILQSLHNNYMKVPGPYKTESQNVYKRLRKNIVNTVFTSYKKNLFFYEQYNQKTGEGQRLNQFTGWTALVTMIMAEKY